MLQSIGEEHHFRQKIASDFETPAAADKCIVNFDTLARCAISGDGRKWTPMLNNRAIVMAVLEPADELVEELIQETKEANGILYKIIGSGRTLFRLFGDMFDRLEQLHSNGWFWGVSQCEAYISTHLSLKETVTGREDREFPGCWRKGFLCAVLTGWRFGICDYVALGSNLGVSMLETLTFNR